MTKTTFQILLKQRVLLFQRRYWNYLNLFFLGVFWLATYYLTKPLFFPSAVHGCGQIFMGGLIFLPLLQIPRVLSLFFSDREASFLLVHPLSLKQYYFFRFGELFVSQFVFIFLGSAAICQSYTVSQDLPLALRSMIVLGMLWFFLVGGEIVLAFFFYRFLSLMRLLLLVLASFCGGFFFSAKTWSWKTLVSGMSEPFWSPFSLIKKMLESGDLFSFFLFLSYIFLSVILGLFLCQVFQLEFLSIATEVNRRKRRFLFRFLFPALKYLPKPSRALIFRDIAILFRKGFPRGGLLLILLPSLILFLLPTLSAKPDKPLLNELGFLLIEVVVFALTSFTLTIDYSLFLREYRVWERSTNTGAWEHFWAATGLSFFFNGFLALFILGIGYFSPIMSGIPNALLLGEKSLLLALSMSFFAGAFYLSAYADTTGADANTYAMSAAFLGIILALILTLKPIWILIYPIYIWSLYNQGKARFAHIEVL